jgi:transcription elongation factor Elf1
MFDDLPIGYYDHARDARVERLMDILAGTVVMTCEQCGQRMDADAPKLFGPVGRLYHATCARTPKRRIRTKGRSYAMALRQFR